jgi:hypothetical protein
MVTMSASICMRRRARFSIAGLVLALAAAVMLGGCDDSGLIETVNPDELAPPLGLRSITGNGEVTLIWFTSNFENGFEGYIVYMRDGDFETDQSATLPAGYVEVDRISIGQSGTPKSFLVQNLENGTTYSFAVCAFRDGGDEVSFASNIVTDTPRPDITSVVLASASTNDVIGDDSRAGFDFEGFTIDAVPLDLASANYTNNAGTDIVHEAFDPGPANLNIRSWLAGMNGAGVQDLGYMDDLDGSNEAPEDGYAGTGESVLLIVGHVYAVQTGNNHYAKLIVTSIQDPPSSLVTFNAAYQTKLGERNYFPALGIH